MKPFAVIAALLVVTLAIAAALQWRRWEADHAEAQRARGELVDAQVDLPERFDPAVIAGLPEPARRFFTFAIEPGARLRTVAEMDMEGEIALGTKEKPGYQPIRAQQVLAAPHGLVWQVQGGSGFMRLSGSDGMVGDTSWTRFWLLRLVPVVRAGGNPDHLRSSFGRVVAEAAFWSPAALLPGPGVQWFPVDADTAGVRVTHAGMTQDVEIRVDPSGQPLWVRMPRWTNANPQNEFRVQPFGGEVGDFRWVEGIRVPFRVDGGNFFGTPDYFPFYRVKVTSMRFR